uniref:Uncharacterized protein n=1 Tax=Candidatus Kentrum sp. LPFa TaxID=2126335 RepID=A0A450VVB8_9GAMM|nr:MAG: hypothetical protein BECKLPF1236A_GA0070988_1002018 [Candidatus Kentron sp. LPFa]
MIPLALRRGDVISRGLVTFPENPEQNDQKIRESKERGISSTFLVSDFPGWGIGKRFREIRARQGLFSSFNLGAKC